MKNIKNPSKLLKCYWEMKYTHVPDGAHRILYSTLMESAENRGVFFGELEHLERNRNPLGVLPLLYLPFVKNSLFEASGLNKLELMEILREYCISEYDQKILSYEKLSTSTVLYYYWRISSKMKLNRKHALKYH